MILGKAVKIRFREIDRYGRITGESETPAAFRKLYRKSFKARQQLSIDHPLEETDDFVRGTGDGETFKAER